MQSRELRKSKENRLIRGTIAGVGEYFGLSRDVITFLRILYVILTFSSFFAGVIVYIVASWIIPDASDDEAGQASSQKQDWEQHSGVYEKRHAERMARRQARYEEKARRKADSWDAGWENHPTKPGQKIKEAQPVEKDEDWSDF
ncbi:PspC domain-containing protein [Lactococcus termiticola]|uniref:Phage shock protein PspC N-terminal domain-containing protein n=1 Tax=Lactococcus termiticola TaxID=2169526 RepID=A0A2R5HG39_9LACT|nr:PspC domain-containing protein [Lactococcus termiticola]GBG96984.1 hypothetical protein NtB2_01121 [Lactococcus termiticola]